MFIKNNNQQMRLDDPINNMPKYLTKILKKSWAYTFQKYIFPSINEERFSVLYSDNLASRPNSPVNVIIGLLAIKELFDLTDEELIGSLNFDIRFQYALRTTSFEKQPVSINTLTNFRNRAYDYYDKIGIDLIQQEVESLSKIVAEYLEIDGKQIRMDSFMVSSSCKNLSRIELVYTVNSNFVKKLNKIAPTLIPDECKVYLEKGHKNETIYKTHNKETESKLEFLLKQSNLLYKSVLKGDKEVIETKEFKLLERMIKEQTDDDSNGNITPKNSKEIASDSLQNPSDPDATYRYKYSDNIGYSANVVEAFDEKNNIIQSYDLQPNIYDDSDFAKDIIKQLPEKEIQLFVDGAYYSYEIAQNALSKGIKMLPGELRGRKPSENKMSYESFTVNKDKNLITTCANNQTPIKSFYNEEKEVYIAKFKKDNCKECPFKSRCRIKEQKKYNTVRFTKREYEIALLREQMDTKEYIKLTNKRSGVEGIPSVFRRKYNVDQMPIRGKVRSKIWFGFKILSYNFKQLFKGVKDLDVVAIINLIFEFILRNYFFEDVSWSY